MFRPAGVDPRFELRPNRWNVIAIPLVISLIALIAWGSREMSAPYHPGEPTAGISLAAWHLPEYALRSVLRMAIALVASLFCTLTVATMAAKNRRAERVIIPVVDILQSVPILGFLTIVVAGFVALFNGNLLGVELASIFAIFTSQAWNMTLSFYQSLKIVPRDLNEASTMFGLSPWTRFWKLEVPFAMPGLVWNTMMSVSGGWFFVVAAEAITVGKYQGSLPGIGSYVALAIQDKNLPAVGYALLAMLVVILAYDQLLFRPLVAWSEKFRLGDTAAQYQPTSWALDLLRRTRALRAVARALRTAVAGMGGRVASVPAPHRVSISPGAERLLRGALSVATWSLATTVVAFGLYRLVATIGDSASARDVLHVFVLGFYTLVRVLVLILIASLVWVPVGVYIGLHPRLAVRAQPIAQFLAAFPANLFFPIAVIVMLEYHLTVRKIQKALQASSSAI